MSQQSDFEKWLDQEWIDISGNFFEKDDEGDYTDNDVCLAWKAYQVAQAPLLAEIASLNAHIKVMQQQLLACLNDVNENLNLTHEIESLKCDILEARGYIEFIDKENESLRHQLANMTALADDASKRCGELQSQINVLRPFYLGPNND